MSRGESQHFKDRTIIGMVIKEGRANIMTLDDREVIMQENPGSSCHIMSDNIIMSNYLMRHTNASEFIMDINIHIKFNYMRDSFTKELNIQLKIILEKITQVDFDITLLIENCGGSPVQSHSVH